MYIQDVCHASLAHTCVVHCSPYRFSYQELEDPRRMYFGHVGGVMVCKRWLGSTAVFVAYLLYGSEYCVTLPAVMHTLYVPMEWRVGEWTGAHRQRQSPRVRC